MNKERLTVFSDAILAIIMTILVLEFEPPEVLSWSGLWAVRIQFFAYTVSFFWLASMWVDMHDEWHDAKSISQPVIWWDLIMLFFSSFVPYSTNLVSEHMESPVAQAVYGITVVLVAVSNMGLRYVLEKANQSDPVLAKKIRIQRKWLYIDTAIKVAAILISVIVYPPAVLITVVVSTLCILFLDAFTRNEIKECTAPVPDNAGDSPEHTKQDL